MLFNRIKPGISEVFTAEVIQADGSAEIHAQFLALLAQEFQSNIALCSTVTEALV